MKITPTSSVIQRNDRKSHSQVAMRSVEACTFLPPHPQRLVGVYDIPGDEVIVYFPTGGFLGDGSFISQTLTQDSVPAR